MKYNNLVGFLQPLQYPKTNELYTLVLTSGGWAIQKNYIFIEELEKRKNE